MKSFMRMLMVPVVLVLSGSPSAGAVYSDSVFVTNDGISAWTQPGGAGSGAQMFWSIGAGVLQPTDYTLGIGHVWYEVSAGDMIGPGIVSSGTEILNSFTGYMSGGVALNPVQFHVGFWLDADTDSSAGSGDRYGWARLRYDGSDLQLLESAISDEGPIRVGVVPEPSGVMFLAGSLVLLVSARQRRGRVGRVG